jgi:hypothetical protein
LSDRRAIAIGLILVTILGLGVVGVILNVTVLDPLQVPPPADPPGEIPEIVISNNLEAWAEAVYWQDFMPFVPEEGPPFYMIVYVNVTNTGNSAITSFEVPRVTIYFHNTSMLLVTLNLHIVLSEWSEIGPGESFLVEFTNDRDTIFSPTIEEGAVLYSSVLTRWGNGSEMILTTPPSALRYTH